jgi:hypothetical protein
LFDEKNQRSKISCQGPFKNLVLSASVGFVYKMIYGVKVSVKKFPTYYYLTIESIPCESFPADAVVRAVGVLALSEWVAVEDVQDAFVVIRAAILRTALHGEAIVAEATEGAQNVFTLAVLTNLSNNNKLIKYK